MKVMKNIEKITPIKIGEVVKGKSGAITSKAVCATDNTDIRFFAYSKGESISKESQEEDSMIYLLEGEINVLYDEDDQKKEMTLKGGEFIVLPSNLNYGMHATEDSKSLNILVK